MFAAIHIPDFPIEAIVRLRSELRERAIAVLEGTPPLLRVMVVNDGGADLGLECGMTKLQAEAIASAGNAVLVPRSIEQENSAQAALLDVACAFSPRVENTAGGLVVLDLTGLDRIFGPPAKIARDLARRCSDVGLEAHVAAASNPDAAIHAARGFSGVTVIPEGREAERLATLPIDVLAAIENEKSKIKNDVGDAADLLNILESWGVRNLRALAALPEVAVSERLGQVGLQWQRLARGTTSRALRLIDSPARFEETCELDSPLNSLEPLAFVLNRMLDQVCARLSARALATNEVRVTLDLDSVDDLEARGGRREKYFCRSLRLPVPMLDAKVFLKLLQLDLQAHPPGAPVIKISLEAVPAEPRRSQSGLFEAGVPEPERLEVILARMHRVIADGPTTTRAGAADLLDTHRSDSFRMRKFATPFDRSTGVSPVVQRPTSSLTIALRRYRPPLAARVVVRNGAPANIECDELSGDICWAAGPWKSSGDWWAEQPWAREEWDICVKGGCFRIYRDTTGWFVEGIYD